MRKQSYSKPIVTITKWAKEDIITTSGVTKSSVTLTLDTVDNGIKTVSFDEIDK